MSKTKLMLVGCLALLMVALPLLGACGSETIVEVPVEKIVEKEVIKEVEVERIVEKEVIKDIPPIKIASMWDITGPYASIGTLLYKGHMDYIRYVNEQGGIGGARIESNWVDHRLDATAALTSYKRMREQGIVTLCTMTSLESTVVKAMLAEDEIPVVCIAAGYDLFVPPGWIYGMWYSMPTVVGGVAKYLHEQWDEAEKGRPMRAAILAWEGPFGKGGADPEMRWLKSAGIEIVAEEWVSMRSLDYTAPLLRIKESGADMVLTTISGAAPGLVCRDAAKIDFPKNVPIITEQAGVGAEAVRKMAGDAISYIVAGQAMYNIEEDKDAPTMKLLREVQEKYHGKLINSADYTGGFHQAMVTVEAIKRAVEKVGLENLNGAAVKEALGTIKDWDGAMTRTVSYGDYDGDRLGAETVRAVRYDTEKQAIVPVSDWFHVPLTLFK